MERQRIFTKELIFEVSYLGGSMPTMAINFSRSASQIIGQYYNFYDMVLKVTEKFMKNKENSPLLGKSVEKKWLL